MGSFAVVCWVLNGSAGGGPPDFLLYGFYAFTFVWLPGMGALASATLVARRDWIVVTVISTLAAIPVVGYELFARNVDTTVTFFGALLVGAYLGSAVGLIVRGGRDADDRLVVGGVTLWVALLVVVAQLDGYVSLETAVAVAGLWMAVLVVAALYHGYVEH